MESRQLGTTELQVSSIGMGCVTFGREIDCDESFAVLDHALERGITLFDTAEAYAGGASETVLGKWMRGRGVRDQLVLATKVSGTLTRQRVMDSAEASLTRLNTDRIDLFQLHNWDTKTPVSETLEALGALIRQGKVRYVGVSNWSAWQLAKALILAERDSLVRLESVQPPYNLVQREVEPDLLPLCVDQQVGVVAYSPLGAGFLTGKYRHDGPIPTGTRFDVIPAHQPIYFTDNGWRVTEGLRVTAGEFGRSMIQLALAWVLNQPAVTSMLIGARSTRHIDQAFEADAAGLSGELTERLNQL